MEDLSYWISSFRNESWYFRIWALFWLICFIVFCIGFGLLSARSAIAAVGPFFNNFFEYIHSKKLLFFLWQIRGEQVTFVTQLNSMTFPRCHFSTISPMTFLSHNCTYQNSPIPIENCPGSNDLTLCFTYVLCIAHTCVFISMSLSRVSFSLSSFHLYRSQVFLFYFFFLVLFVVFVVIWWLHIPEQILQTLSVLVRFSAEFELPTSRDLTMILSQCLWKMHKPSVGMLVSNSDPLFSHLWWHLSNNKSLLNFFFSDIHFWLLRSLQFRVCGSPPTTMHGFCWPNVFGLSQVAIPSKNGNVICSIIQHNHLQEIIQSFLSLMISLLRLFFHVKTTIRVSWPLVTLEALHFSLSLCIPLQWC